MAFTPRRLMRGASGAGGLIGPDSTYQISRSLRFNSADSAYLDRTLTTPTNNQKWTFSEWIKRSSLSTNQFVLQAGNTLNDEAQWYFQTDNTLRFYQYTGTYQYDFTTVQVFRDPSAWYHLVVQYDSTQATTANRFIVYINGSQITLTTSTSVSLNATNSKVNSAVSHDIGGSNIEARWSNVYLTEINFIDGQALTPSSFGSTNAQTGVWQPKAYSGSYGTNGFYLNFSDNSNTTAATLGKDYSGNGNNWTPNNFSVTAGAGNDSLVDVPTSYGLVDTGVGGTVRGNYCTLNPVVDAVYGGTYAGTFTNGNLDYAQSGNASHGFGTMAVPSTSSTGYYFEAVCTTMDINRTYIGLIDPLALPAISTNTASYGFPYKAIINNSGFYYNYASGTSGNFGYTTYTSYAQGDVIMVAYKNGTIWIGKNGTWMNSGNPAAGTGYLDNTIDTTKNWLPYVGYNSNFTINFGQRPFAYTAPSGFKTLCTRNLPVPTIGATTATQAGKYFNPVLYTGTGSSQSITGVGFQPDWVWIKGRSGATDHGLYDAVRGVQKQLESNNTDAETTETTGITAFGSDGFTTGALAQLNTSAATYVAWNWKANGAGSSNPSGSITSTVSASTTSGFSVVTYTGTGANATVGHGLGVAPKMVIIKGRGNADNWIVYNAYISNPTTHALILNSNSAPDNDSTYFNSTAPTSTVFSVGTDASTNQNTIGFVAYCFAPIEGYSAFGIYTGANNTGASTPNANGPFIHTGFRPRFVLIKRTSAAGTNWVIYDSVRGTYNANLPWLYPNASSAETSTEAVDFLSNGFKIRSESGATMNPDGGTFIYAAFAESPFKYSLAR